MYPFPSPDIVFQSVGKDLKWSEAGRLARLLQDPFRAREPEVDSVSLASGAVLLPGGSEDPQPQWRSWSCRGRIRGVLQRCRAHGIILNKKKFEIGHHVHFAGYNVTDKGIRPDQERLGAISEFPTHLLRSILGLTNQLGNFLPDLAAGAVQMRGHPRKRMALVCTPDHDKQFVTVKKLLTSAPVAHYFDPQLEFKLLTDARRSGIGFALIQEGPDGQKRLITCGLRGLNSLAGWWELFGFPSVFQAVGGPQFRCQEFMGFCKEREIELETCIPYILHLNGLAEAAVKNCKKLFLKCIAGGENFAEALLEFRNCPRPDWYSPEQLMFGRRLRLALPVAAGAFEPVSIGAANEAQRKTHDAALAEI